MFVNHVYVTTQKTEHFQEGELLVCWSNGGTSDHLGYFANADEYLLPAPSNCRELLFAREVEHLGEL